MDFKTILQFPVLDTVEILKILQEIADIERQEERPEMPQVTISIFNDSASGFFVNYDSEKNIILLCDMYDRKAQFQYIASSSISSISIRNVNKYGYLLSDGKIPFTPDESEIPTLLQLKKDIKALELEINEAIGKDITIKYNYDGTPEDLDKFYALKVLGLLEETLSKIATDKLAKEAFTASISEIEFTLGTENKATLENGIISIILDTSKGLKSLPKAVKLQEHIEKNL
ncbi:hypothetical protein [Winogradskyella vidalii]|uniref:hypothetical protein n=1 Tax=Winogradskyella vidalii TaxID=2615024 RepID=UPI0015CA9178|nr:hypothetical protein [Winogradskyella vidalii]